MMKSGMMRSGIDQIGQTHLRDTAQTLKIRMLDEIKNQGIGYRNETVNRIVEYFEFIGRIHKKRIRAQI